MSTTALQITRRKRDRQLLDGRLLGALKTSAAIPLQLMMVALLALLGCSPPASSTLDQATTAQRSTNQSIVPLRNIDAQSLLHQSRLLAGVVDESTLAGGDTGDLWLTHAEAMEEIWPPIARRLEAMSAWSATELATASAPSAPLVFPFGGADLTSLLSLFPKASSYLLTGDLAPGQLPLPENFSAESLADQLPKLRRAWQSFVERGQLAGLEGDRGPGKIDGVLPLLLIGLVRSGQVPLDLAYVTIDTATLDIEPVADGTLEASAVRVGFAHEATPDERRVVYYVAQDLSDAGLLTDEPLSRLWRRQAKVNVHLRSAAYRPAMSDYSNLRQLVLDTAQTLVQDDSGLPLRYLTSDRWALALYGRYKTVPGVYRRHAQDDLAAVYARDAGIAPLPFDIGYRQGGDGDRSGNLLIAERLADDLTLPR